MRLVADVGGTNARVGLARNGALLGDTVRSYRNDDFASFDDVLARFKQEIGPAPLTELAVAVAGPVGDGSARLTNRNWRFSEVDLSRAHGGIPAVLLNDLGALGQALPALSEEGLAPVWGRFSDRSQQGATGAASQALVIGIGTGFNVSPMVTRGGQSTCLNAEAGHVALPHDIHALLQGRIGARAAEFATVEHLFSGRGLAALHAALSGRAEDPRDILSGGDDANRAATQALFAETLALLCRNLLLAYLPTGGLAFAGSVARGLFASPARDGFINHYTAPMALEQVQHAPIAVIRDDAAALRGCAMVATR